jgi:hypothetical protein
MKINLNIYLKIYKDKLILKIYKIFKFTMNMIIISNSKIIIIKIIIININKGNNKQLIIVRIKKKYILH